jgi:hypothetical protein
MAVIVREMTTCYKCENLIMAERGAVHPLCGECSKSFEDWFEEQLKVFK